MERAAARIGTTSFFLISRADQSDRQYRCDLEFDQSCAVEWPYGFGLLSLGSERFAEQVEYIQTVLIDSMSILFCIFF